MGTPSLSNRPFPFNFFSSPWPAQCLGSQVANAALGRRGLLRMLDYKPALGLGGKTAVFGPWPVQCLGSQAAVLVPSGHRSGPVYVATSVGAGRLLLADSTRGEPPFCGPPRWVQETGKRQPSRGAGERAGAQQAQKRTARLGGPSSMQGRLIGRYKRPAASLPGRRGFPGRRGWSGSQRSGGRRTCTPAHRQCPRPKSAPRPYRRPFGPFPAG